jgi:hypothetical protein
MTKLREDGLITNPRWHDGPFAGILLGGMNEMNGAKVENPIMIVSVATNPAADETIGIGTKTYTFKNSGASGDQINLGASAALTAAAIIAKINSDNMGTTNVANSPLCSAYTLGNTTKILLVDNKSQSHHASPAWINDGAKVVEEFPWMESITQHMLLDFDYFRVPITDDTVKPIALTEQKYGGAASPSYQNFLY